MNEVTVNYDMLIPFAILLALVIYLIYTRNSFEKNMVSLYESKFEEWKKHINVAEDKEVTKELAGLVFKKGYKVEIELLNEDVKSNLERGKFEIRNLKDEN
jgi:hypothetical protein